MKKTYTVAYGPTWWEIQVSIDEEFISPWIDPGTDKPMTGLEVVKSLVEFWSGWEQRLASNKGDYIKTFLQQLASEVISLVAANNWTLDGVLDEFSDKDGYCPMDGSCGIEILHTDEFSFEDDEFQVLEDLQ